jgi:hypothetical protein
VIGGPIPDPRAKVLAEIDRKIANFYGSGGQATKAPGFEPRHPPSRSKVIDPETVLKRRCPPPTRAERIALRRMTEAL